ncbi:MAG: hypothetical protein WC107_07465 [Patescibacteria group bacterium]
MPKYRITPLCIYIDVEEANVDAALQAVAKRVRDAGFVNEEPKDMFSCCICDERAITGEDSGSPEYITIKEKP